MVYGQRFLYLMYTFMVCGFFPSLWFMVYGFWFIVYSFWFMANGLWFLVFGFWLMVNG
jgi:hypothetical protein